MLGPLVCLMLALSVVANSAAIVIPPFQGTHSESFEEFAVGTRASRGGTPWSILGGTGLIDEGNDPPYFLRYLMIYRTANDFFTPNHFGLGPSSAKTADGIRGLGHSVSDVNARLDLLQPITRFGAYWGGSSSNGINFTFFNATGDVVGQDRFYWRNPGRNGVLEWAGWEFTEPVTRIEYTGAFIVVDSMQVTVAPDPTPPELSCPEPLTLECSNGWAVGTIQVGVLDTNGFPVEVIWTVDGTVYQTDHIASGGTITSANVTFTANFSEGEHTVVISASNGQTTPVNCSTTVTVRDTTPPTVSRISVTPDMLWPPNHRMVPASVVVDVVDNCDPSPLAHITHVISNESKNPFEPDWEITGPLSLKLRAERSGKAGQRTYTIVVACEDESGNVSTATVDVVVPHDRR